MQNIPEWQYHPNEDIIDRMRRRRQKCIMNLIIIAVNVILFLAAEATGGSENTEHMVRMGASYTPLVEGGEYWRLFTVCFCILAWHIC